ncbi:MAG: hypothetical protein WC393_00460 [Candidatus Nanoarchaeia archaeon]|jgi:hypothetical protein
MNSINFLYLPDNIKSVNNFVCPFLINLKIKLIILLGFLEKTRIEDETGNSRKI